MKKIMILLATLAMIIVSCTKKDDVTPSNKITTDTTTSLLVEVAIDSIPSDIEYGGAAFDITVQSNGKPITIGTGYQASATKLSLNLEDKRFIGTEVKIEIAAIGRKGDKNLKPMAEINTVINKTNHKFKVNLIW